MKRTHVLLALAAGCLSLAGTAQAAILTFSFNNTIETTEINNQTGNLGLFNTSLGTLTGASIELRAFGVMSLGATNNAAQAQNVVMSSSSSFYFDSTLAPLDALFTAPIATSVGTGLQTYAVGETKSFGPLNFSGSYAADLSSILGSLSSANGGLFGVSCSSLTGLSVFGGGGNISTTQSTQAGCGASVSYSYDVAPPTSVPEPGTLALLGVGLAGLGFASRRRRA